MKGATPAPLGLLKSPLQFTAPHNKAAATYRARGTFLFAPSAVSMRCAARRVKARNSAQEDVCSLTEGSPDFAEGCYAGH